MRLDRFDYPLPPAAIAQRPISPRDAARLLAVTPEGLADRRVRELPRLLRPGDVLVTNDTRVIPARLMGQRGEARIEVTLHAPASAGRWRAFARPAKRLKTGDRIDFAPGFAAAVEARGEGGEVTLAFDRDGAALTDALDAFGAMPLPPYIKRPEQRRSGLADERDRTDYQTVFAARPGAVAAPTAGLHFTDRLLRALRGRGIRRATLTLHVDAGTFLPVRTEHLAGHVMHAEWGRIDATAARAINAARAAGGQVVAVGTTVVRLLESAAGRDGRVRPFSGETSLFIKPGYRFRVVDRMLTNFHLPRSTLFVLVSAFAGTGEMQRAYRHAVATGYRFYSYGDCCLLHPKAGR